MLGYIILCWSGAPSRGSSGIAKEAGIIETLRHSMIERKRKHALEVTERLDKSGMISPSFWVMDTKEQKLVRGQSTAGVMHEARRRADRKRKHCRNEGFMQILVWHRRRRETHLRLADVIKIGRTAGQRARTLIMRRQKCGWGTGVVATRLSGEY